MRANFQFSMSSPSNQSGIIVGIDYAIWLVGTILVSIAMFSVISGEAVVLFNNLKQQFRSASNTLAPDNSSSQPAAPLL